MCTDIKTKNNATQSYIIAQTNFAFALKPKCVMDNNFILDQKYPYKFVCNRQ